MITATVFYILVNDFKLSGFFKKYAAMAIRMINITSHRLNPPAMETEENVTYRKGKLCHRQQIFSSIHIVPHKNKFIMRFRLLEHHHQICCKNFLGTPFVFYCVCIYVQVSIPSIKLVLLIIFYAIIPGLISFKKLSLKNGYTVFQTKLN